MRKWEQIHIKKLKMKGLDLKAEAFSFRLHDRHQPIKLWKLVNIQACKTQIYIYI